MPALYDVSLLGLMWGTLNSFLHGVAIVETANVGAQQFLLWAHMWLEAIKTFTADHAAQIDAGDGRFPADDATLETHLEALKHLVHESEALGVDAELPKYSQALMERSSTRATPGTATPPWSRRIASPRSKRRGTDRFPVRQRGRYDGGHRPAGPAPAAARVHQGESP